jgi:uncharacterized protein (TIGR02391 family)
MVDSYNKFQSIALNAHKYSEHEARYIEIDQLHPFEDRNVHPDIDKITRKLFDDGHFAQATFEAFKFIDKKVQKLSKSKKFGKKLMMAAFNEESPLVKLTDLTSTSEIDEQEGYKFLFAGAVLAIRNPRGHEVAMHETPDQCLDHISLASLLLRRLNDTK